MLRFRNLDVYRCALEALPIVYSLAAGADADMRRQARRAMTSVLLNIAEGTGRRDDDQRHFYRVARGSALEVAAALDALQALGTITASDTRSVDVLLVRVVSMLTKLAEPAKDEAVRDPASSGDR